MFNVTDTELDGIEAMGPRGPSGETAPAAWSPFGNEEVTMPGGDASLPAPLPGPLPIPGTSTALATGAGRALVFVTAGLVGGWIAGGPMGGAAGVVAAGAIRNFSRTKQTWSSPSDQDRAEAGRSLTMGIFGLGVAVMLGYQAYKLKTEE